MKSVKLSNGVAIPAIGMGMWKNIIPSSVNRTVKASIEAGYTHFDSAQVYRNEEMLARALEKNKFDRKNLFITTKIANANQAEGRFRNSLDDSLRKLRTEYVDLLLLHFPVSRTRSQAWKMMEESYSQGKAKSIGVSNYTIKHLEQLLSECSVKPMVNQVELHVYLQQPELLEFCKKHDILVEAYSPLAHGHGLKNPVLEDIAKKHNKTPAQIMIRWCLEVGTLPLPKSTHPDRINQNIDVFDFKLDNDDMDKIKGLESGLRTCWDPTDIE